MFVCNFYFVAVYMDAMGYCPGATCIVSIVLSHLLYMTKCSTWVFLLACNLSLHFEFCNFPACQCFKVCSLLSMMMNSVLFKIRFKNINQLDSVLFIYTENNSSWKPHAKPIEIHSDVKWQFEVRKLLLFYIIWHLILWDCNWLKSRRLIIVNTIFNDCVGFYSFSVL